MAYLLFLFGTIMNILTFIYPFLVKFDVRFNFLKLKGKVIFTIFNKFKFEFKIRIKHGYIYINHKKKLRKEKISASNVNVIFFMHLINQFYFRQQYLQCEVSSNFGYSLDSATTAVGCGFIDVLSKCILSKIKNNKKTAHIFVNVEPKYNQDVLNLRVANTVRLSVVDIIYALVYTQIYSWRSYEKQRKHTVKQR